MKTVKGLLFILSLLPGLLWADGLSDKFIEARKALKADDEKQYFSLKTQLKDYPLYDYLQSLEIEQNFENYSDELILQWLAENKGTYWAHLLRDKWMNYLGEHNQWHTYLKVYRSGNTKQKCWYYSALLSQNKRSEALAPFVKLWTTRSTLPNACKQAIQALEDSAYDTPKHRLEKINLLIKTRRFTQARSIAKRLTKKQQDFVDAWIKAWDDPDQYFDHFIRSYHKQKLFGKATVSIMDRFAAASPEKAADYWIESDSKHVLTDRTENLARAEIATSLARIHDKKAIYWLDAVSNQYADSLLWQWRIRTAVYWQAWPYALRWSSELPDYLANKDVWRYWYAVSLWHQGHKDKADDIWRELAEIRDYYGFLAADQINGTYAVESTPKTPSESAVKKVMGTPLVEQTQALYDVGEANLAANYWRWSVKRVSDSTALTAAYVANQWHRYYLSIYAFSAAGYYKDLDKRFPIAFYDLIKKQTKQYNINPVWVLGLMRQESHFRVGAKSWVGARGLMQLMPKTARFIAKKYDIPYKEQSDLNQPEINIALGVANLNYELKNFGGNILLATAAYNAGEGNVGSWLPPKEMRAQRWVLSIPFRETRHYVNNILAYYIIYQHVKFGNTSVRLSDIMERIPPR